MEDVERVQNFGNENFQYRLFWHVNLTFSKFHSLELSQILVSESSRVIEGDVNNVVGKLAVEFNRYEFMIFSIPLKVDETVSEA